MYFRWQERVSLNVVTVKMLCSHFPGSIKVRFRKVRTVFVTDLINFDIYLIQLASYEKAPNFL